MLFDILTLFIIPLIFTMSMSMIISYFNNKKFRSSTLQNRIHKISAGPHYNYKEKNNYEYIDMNSLMKPSKNEEFIKWYNELNK